MRNGWRRAALGGEAVVFADGIGEYSAEIRERVAEGLGSSRKLDTDANARMVNGAEGPISTDGSRLHARRFLQMKKS